MTLFDNLKAHIGGLICIKTDLCWYDSDVWDGIEGRICLLLDVLDPFNDPRFNGPFPVHAGTPTSSLKSPVAGLLLINSTSIWVWLDEAAVDVNPGGDQCQ